MDVLDGDLEAVESASFGDLHFLHEADAQVFVDDAVRGGKEGEDVGDEVAFVVVERFPVLDIAAKINFFSCTEGNSEEGEEMRR